MHAQPRNTADRLIAIRYTLQWSVAALARSVGVSRTTVYKYLKGKPSCTPRGRRRLQDALDARAREMGKAAPRFWPDSALAASSPTSTTESR